MSFSMPGGVLPKSFPYGSPGIVMPAGVVEKGQNYTEGGGATGNYFRNTRLRNFRCSPEG